MNFEKLKVKGGFNFVNVVAVVAAAVAIGLTHFGVTDASTQLQEVCSTHVEIREFLAELKGAPAVDAGEEAPNEEAPEQTEEAEVGGQ